MPRETDHMPLWLRVWFFAAGAIALGIAGFITTHTTGILDDVFKDRHPLTVAVNEKFDDDGALCHAFVTQHSLADIPALEEGSTDSILRWRQTYRAVDAGYTNLELSVQGKSSDTLILQSLDVVIVSKSVPIRGNTIFLGSGCGGGTSPRYFDVNLDNTHPRAVAKPAAKGGALEHNSVHFPYTVSNSNVEIFDVTARAKRHSVSWYLVLKYTSKGEAHRVTIKDEGRPFETTKEGSDLFWVDGAWQ